MGLIDAASSPSSGKKLPRLIFIFSHIDRQSRTGICSPVLEIGRLRRSPRPNVRHKRHPHPTSRKAQSQGSTNPEKDIPQTLINTLLTHDPLMKNLCLLSLVLLTGSLQAGTDAPTAAAPSTPPLTVAPDDDVWSFRASPYAWVTAIEGDTGLGGLTAPVDISMGDTLEDLDFAYMGIFEASRGPWALGLDVVYGQTSDDFEAGGRLVDGFSFEQKQWLLTPFVAYRAVQTERYHMDVFAGARITVLQADLTAHLSNGGSVSTGSDIDWVDPIIGIRGQGELSDTLFFRYNADIGGFGASSELVWQAFAGLGYRLNSNFSLVAGYRGLGVDYDNGRFMLDTVTHGPVIGLDVRF